MLKKTRGAPVAALMLLMTACSGASIVDSKDEYGRVYQIASYQNSALREFVEIQYSGTTNRPLKKIYKVPDGPGLALFREEVFHYSGDILSNIRYYIFINNKKILCGKVTYKFHNRNQPLQVEYYSIISPRNRSFIRSGIDIYQYEKNVLESRRIIEYGYHPPTRQTVQLSQYAVGYKNNELYRLNTWVLDKKKQKIIKKEESDLAIITEMIKNLEKSLIDRTKGMKFKSARR